MQVLVTIDDKHREAIRIQPGLRWHKLPGTGTEPPVLQQLFEIESQELMGGNWWRERIRQEWRDVPTIVD